MSFARYPEYKDSRTDYLGKIPVHWKLKRLKNCAEVFPSNVDKKSVEGQIPVKLCNYTDVYYNDIIDADLNFMSATATKEQIKRFKLEQGDVVFTKDSESANDIGVAALVPKKVPGVIYGYHLSIARPLNHVSGNFLKRYFDSEETKAYFEISANGLTRVGLGQYAVDNAPIALPSLDEQTQIARFLDHETAKIDALIGEQERLIELLQEKRQAVISHAVTKGLDPDVPMKDSGVEWLGEVPAHWEIKRIKHVVRSLDQGWSPQCESQPVEGSNEYGVLKVGCVNQGLFRPDENKKLPDYLEPDPQLAVKADDLLVSRANTRELVGHAAVTTIDHPNLMISDKLYRLRLEKELASPHYVSYFLGVPMARRVIELEASGASSSMLNISQKTIMDMPLPCPPVLEQYKIRDEIIRQTYGLLALGKQAIDLVTYLKERRSALISAAVTGKIDVRNWQPPVDESAFDEEVRQAGMEATA